MTPTTIKPPAASGRRVAVIGLAYILALAPAFSSAKAQALSVLPVNIQMAPGQGATTMTVMNHGESETSVQIRAYAWGQQDGDDQLTGSDAVMVSPPIATIPQVVPRSYALCCASGLKDRRQLTASCSIRFRLQLNRVRFVSCCAFPSPFSLNRQRAR